MQRLREVVGDAATKQQSPVQSGEVKLDEQSISREDLNARIQSQSPSQRIVEVKDGEFKTLKRMYS